MSIEVRGLTKIYGEQKAIDSISFNVNKGEIVGFLGPNGAGKSTTMKIITGYLEQNEGEAKVCGMDTNANPIPVKKKIGYLPEANPLYPDMFVKEYLSFIASLHHLKNKKEKIDHVIQLVGLTPERKKKISQLSKGYKQRVGLAAALLHDPEVLILDEPTSGLDPNQIAEIREVIKTLGKHKTVLFSSHILQEVEAICDRVIIINKGKLVADSRMSELKQLQSGNLVQIIFKEQINKNLFDKISKIRSIRNIDPYHWELQSDEPAELKKQLLELALQNNLNIVSLQSEGSRLEDIFRALTA
ncbi:MAG TPA: gliding motility-associated ABC transporter ATP-binding subunit GldA [Puia sp.]|nr:gliding motility-associated ABC transporter ATP-binding subunit GldA [Puia sp.]